MMKCLACDLIEHPEEVPGGRIATIGSWVVEHCVGPLGVGTVVVKPLRHVIHLADLDPVEAAQLGPLLADVARAVTSAQAEAGEPVDQVYVCLWSHAERRPGHIHFVVQPVSAEVMARHDAHGPKLQTSMFEAAKQIDPSAAARAAERIRARLNSDGHNRPLPLSLAEKLRPDR
jgi:diadenosine tetraphosphate (Ap4A) HIT family hydrolase